MNAHEPGIAGEPLGIESLEAFIDRIAPDFVAPFKSRFGAMFLDELDDHGEEFEFLIDGYFSLGDKSVVGGPSQSGKSFLAIHAGMCVATGRDFFGAKVKQGLVVYQAGEGARGVKKRLRAWRRHHGVVFSRETPFVLLKSAIDIYKPDGDTGPLIEEIKTIAALYDVPLRMVVIDTLATASGGAEENSSRDMGMVMANIARINAATSAHVCLVHHLNAGGTKLRGSTAIYANVDQVVLVTRNETTKVRTAFLDKQKDEESGSRFQFELMSVNLGATADDRPITSCVCLPVGEKESVRKTEEAKGFVLNAGEVVFMQALFTAEKKHGRAVPPELNLPAAVRAIVAYDDLKRAYVELSPSDAIPVEGGEEDDVAAKERHRDGLKKRLARARETLSRFKIIGVKGLDMWWTGRSLRAFPQTLPHDELPPLDMGDGSVSEIPF
jgi:hypothetical protein